MYFIFKFFKKIKPKIIRGCKFEKDTAVEGGSELLFTTIDSHSYCGYDCRIHHSKIGKYVSIGDNVTIGMQNHRMDLISTSPCFVKQKDSIKEKYFDAQLPPTKTTIIGNDVWIGSNVVIKAGVKLGNGCIIGTGSVVTKDVQPYSIVGGNPASLIRFRFDSLTIEKLQKYCWWDLSETIIKENNGFFGDAKVFIEWYESLHK